MKTLLLGALALAAAVAVPGVSFAQTFAYVNQAGEVMTYEATTDLLQHLRSTSTAVCFSSMAQMTSSSSATRWSFGKIHLPSDV
jgi:hypothetical protein